LRRPAAAKHLFTNTYSEALTRRVNVEAMFINVNDPA